MPEIFKYLDRLDPLHDADPNRFTSTATASVSNHFAWLRTRLGLERTAMAWVRTGASLIGFGFTIVQFLERVAGKDTPGHIMRPETPRDLGLALIGAGVLALLISTYQYRRMVKYLGGEQFAAIAGVAKTPTASPVMLINVAIILVGVFAFLSVLFHF